MGSPPHSWRILCLYRQKVVRLRITSTLVENTIFYIDQSNKCWDHLHTRGEYCHHLHAKSALEGSPPHSWRILTKQQPNRLILGITSTLVENTFQENNLHLNDQDHLHTRGEYNCSLHWQS